MTSTTTAAEGSRRAPVVLALTLWAASVGLLVATAFLVATDVGAGKSLDPAAVAVLIFVMAFATVGALVAARRPRMPSGRSRRSTTATALPSMPAVA